MTDRRVSHSPRNFRTFFFRGLGILLPSILTLWILVAVFRFVDTNIAAPINAGVQESLIRFTPWPPATDEEIAEYATEVTPEQAAQRRAAVDKDLWNERHARRVVLQRIWNNVSIAGYPVLDIIGLLVAVILIYFAGLVLGSFFGRRLYKRGEALLQRVPLFKQVYPYVKQVTDFLVGDEQEKIKFNRVVAVEYPRKGLWSVGLVTGDTMRIIQDRAEVECMTVFVPSSPTPFTGYVITVPVTDTIDLPITIDDALRFTVSGGVIVPESQVILRPGGEATLFAADGANGGDGTGDAPGGPIR